MKLLINKIEVLVSVKRLAVYAIPVVLLFLSACFKEKPLNRPSSEGIGQVSIIEMGPAYATEFFYSLETNSVISSNSRFVYDLMFDCDNGKFNIWLNTAKFLSVVRTGKTDLETVTIKDTINLEWHYEIGAYSPDSNAIGEWWNTYSAQPVSAGEVYIINLGLDENGDPCGFMKMKVNDFYGSSYSISYESFDGGDTIRTMQVSKDASRNYRYLTFNDGGRILDNIEPDKSTWDFCFTHYSVVFYEPYYLPYQVTGVLTNPSRVQAYMDSTVNFNDITLDSFDVNRMQGRRDIVGYDWKRFKAGYYDTKMFYTYFIKTDETHFYKLRFLDFYRGGEKGYPTFEFVQL